MVLWLVVVICSRSLLGLTLAFFNSKMISSSLFCASLLVSSSVVWKKENAAGKKYVPSSVVLISPNYTSILLKWDFGRSRR